MRLAFKECNEILGRIDGLYHEAAVKLKLSDSEMNILYTMQSFPEGCNQSAIYKGTGLTKSTVNTALKKMQKNNIIEISPGDGRNTWVSVTSKGHKLIKNTVGKVREIENEIYDSWAKSQQDTFMQLISDYAEKLKDKINQL